MRVIVPTIVAIRSYRDLNVTAAAMGLILVAAVMVTVGMTRTTRPSAVGVG